LVASAKSACPCAGFVSSLPRFQLWGLRTAASWPKERLMQGHVATD
jgi:hypothetical protein